MTPKEDVSKTPTTTPKDESAAQCAAPIVISAELLTALQSRFKLIESESRAYTVLLVMGQLTADEVSSYSGIPILKVKTVIEALEKKQLIKSLPGVVARYRAFAPYKELAEEVQAFTKDTEKSWKELQKLETKTLSEIHEELQSLTRQTRNALESLNERQGIALNEAAMATNIVLSNVAENLQKSLENLASSSETEITQQSQQIHQSLDNIIGEGITQLEDTQKLASEDATRAMSAHQEETKQWISTTADQLIAQSTELSQQVRARFDDANNLLHRNVDSGIKAINSEITSQKEGIAELSEETASSYISNLEPYTQELQQVLEVLQKENSQVLTKHSQILTTQIRDTWAQRIQALDNLLAELNRVTRKENRRLGQQTKKALAKIESTIKTHREATLQNVEALFQDWKKVHDHASQELKRVHREAEAVVTEWPPSSLDFTQITKIKTSTASILEQLETEHDKLLESTSQALGVEIQNTYLAQLLEVHNQLQALIKASKTQQSSLSENFKSIADQVGRRLKRRLRTVKKTAEAFLSDFQTKVELQEEQQRTLSKEIQKLLSSEAAAAIKALETSEKQLTDYAGTRLTQAETAIKKSSRENLAQVTKTQTIVEKQARSFQAAMKKINGETESELQTELTKLEKIIRQYSEGIESTTEKLRAEQNHTIEIVVGGYQPAVTERQDLRDSAVSKAIRSLTTQLEKRNQIFLTNLNKVLSDEIPTIALSALNKYQTTLKKKNTAALSRIKTATEAVISEQLTETTLKDFNSMIVKSLTKQSDDVSKSFQEFLSTQQIHQDQQAESALSLAQNELVEILGQGIAKSNKMTANAFLTQMKPIIRDCKTKISRQTKREKQIDKLFLTTYEKIEALSKVALARAAKTKRDKFSKELLTIFQSFKTKLEKQTSREDQIENIFQSSINRLEELPSTTLTEITQPQLDNQLSSLLAIFVDYQSALKRQHLVNTKQITKEFQSHLKRFLQTNCAKILKPQLTALLKSSGKEVMETYRTKTANEQISKEVQAETIFQTTLEKQLRSQLQPKIREFSTIQRPLLTEPIEKFESNLNEKIRKFDSDSRAIVEKHWLPLTKIIDEFSAAVVANLTALNTASGTAIDQASVNLNASLSNFADVTANLLTTTMQTFDREKSTIKEQVTQGLSEMREDCIAQIQETQALLETIGTDISAQRDATTEKITSMSNEIENTTALNLTALREGANSFIESIQTELQTQEDRVNDLKKTIQELMHKEGVTQIKMLNRVQEQLENFSKTQILKAQKIIETIGQTCTTLIAEQRVAINQLFEGFSVSLSEETEDYVSTLEQELTQLQISTSKLVEKIGETGKIIDTELNTQADSSREELRNGILNHYTTLSTDTSSTFQSLIEQSREGQTQLLDNLKQVKEEGGALLDQNQVELNTKITNTLNDLLSRNDQTYKTQLSELKTKTQSIESRFRENLSTASDKLQGSTDQLLESLTASLTNSETELTKLFSDSIGAIENAKQAFQTKVGQELELALQSQSKAMSLTESRLNRANQDSIRRTTDSLQNFKTTALKDLQQKTTIMVGAINQVLDNAKEGLVTQTQQTGRRVSRTLGKERQILKTEYQTLTKEITARVKTAETTAVNTLQLFSSQTEPTLNRLRTQAGQTEEILIGLWDTLTKMEPAEAERTWRIVTCEGIQNHLLDMFRRVDETITLVYPSFDEVPIAEISRIQPQNRVHIITTLDGDKHQASAQKLLQQGNIRIWNNPKMEFYGGSRDGEEVLIAPTYGNQGEIVAVVSDQASYIALFNQTLGPRWISASNEILLRS
ncbi:MAG: helix-turn-helix domain-containing protein [Promethearchaeota archaeon]